MADNCLDELIYWLEDTDDPKATYNYYSSDNCLIAHFREDYLEIDHTRDHLHTFEGCGYDPKDAYDFVVGRRPWTYGEALFRARALQSGNLKRREVKLRD